jgi:hypothetical protein
MFVYPLEQMQNICTSITVPTLPPSSSVTFFRSKLSWPGTARLVSSQTPAPNEGEGRRRTQMRGTELTLTSTAYCFQASVAVIEDAPRAQWQDHLQTPLERSSTNSQFIGIYALISATLSCCKKKKNLKYYHADIGIEHPSAGIWFQSQCAKINSRSSIATHSVVVKRESVRSC